MDYLHLSNYLKFPFEFVGFIYHSISLFNSFMFFQSSVGIFQNRLLWFRKTVLVELILCLFRIWTHIDDRHQF